MRCLHSFDLACDYGNEAEVGEGFKRAFEEGIVTRKDIWVTSKLWNTFHRKEHVKPAIEKTLADLQLEYLDLYLTHFPISLKFVPFEKRYPPEWFHDPEAENPRMEFDPVPLSETWGAMEALVDAGLTRNIGICNMDIQLITDLLSYARIKPAVLQVELHPYLTQPTLVRWARSQGIAVTGFSPLGAGSYASLNMSSMSESVLTDPSVLEIASRYKKTPAQVVLRWGVQRGTSVVPKSTKVHRLVENISIFDFALTEADMVTISALNRNRRFNDPGVFCEAAFNTYCPIYC